MSSPRPPFQLLQAIHYIHVFMYIYYVLSIQLAEGDLNCELDTYKQSRQGLDEMYNEARRQLKEECQLRQVCVYIKMYLMFRLCGGT